MGDIAVRNVDREAMLAELREFEMRYNVPSSRLADAFRTPDGRLHETHDFLRWSFVYGFCKRRNVVTA